jgi:hypothetical protein
VTEPAGPVSGWTPEKIEAARRRIRRQGSAILAVILAGGCVYAMRPQYTDVSLTSGRSYSVVSVLHNSEAIATPSCGVHAWTELLITYYPRTRDSAAITRDAEDLTELGDSAVRQTGDSLLVIKARLPIVSRWIPLATSHDVRYKRAAARWVSVGTGPWPPWVQCGPASKPMAS